MGPSIILGDSGYALSKWLMVPFANPASAAERRFNTAHKKGRTVVERCNGVLKMRFRCLTKNAMFQPHKVSKIVGACAALHNFATEKRVHFEDDIDPDFLFPYDMQEHDNVYNASPDGIRMRNDIVRKIFF